MIPRDLIRLPTGDYRLTDGIRNYGLMKIICDDGMIMYRIKPDFTNQVICLYENRVPVFEDQKKPEMTTLSSMIMIGMFSVHSDSVWSSLSYFKFIQRGSFSKFCRKTNQ